MGGFQPNGAPHFLPGDRLNQFAVVIYVPDPLASFLDDLRLRLVPSCNPHAHISVLPPRPISVPAARVAEEIRAGAAGLMPFEIEAGREVKLFAASNVLYLDLVRGAAKLRAMYRKLNAGALLHDEIYPYYPHLTLAQEFDPALLDEVREEAARRWAEYKGGARFRAESLAFVQNTTRNCWIDLAEVSLRAVPSAR